MKKLPKAAKIGLLICGALVLFVFLGRLGIKRFLFDGGDERGSHVARVDWLPAAASDITYYKVGGILPAMEFECAFPQKAFEAYAQDQGWKLEERKNYNVSGLRYTKLFGPIRKSQPLVDAYPQALVHENRLSNGGGTIVAYDVEYQRLWVWESSH